MNASKINIVPLSQLIDDQEADFFALLQAKELLRTKDGKPYFRVTFCDANRDVSFPVWSDAALFSLCRDEWKTGEYFKIRAIYRSNNFGAKLDILKIRPVTEFDQLDGFSPYLCRPGSTIEPEIMFDEMIALIKTHIDKGPLQKLVLTLFRDQRQKILETAASRFHHHPYFGGLLEHSLSVTKLAVSIFNHYWDSYPKLRKAISRSLVVAGAALHDLGQITEMTFDVVKPTHTIEGELIGHSVLGLDFIRQYALKVDLDSQTQARLEHIILTHSRFQDWGAPKPPMTLEAMIVHYADYSESTFSNAIRILERDDSQGLMTNKKGPFGTPLLRYPELNAQAEKNNPIKTNK
ncbi:MAG: HD domain-containing protein [Planctomycetia bacterium]|nr:HD domain-containing protein [Planctomycetia bacterium]